MNYLLSQLTTGTYVIAIEDTQTWDVPSYTNVYVLRRDGQTILIDAGAKNYQTAVTAALAGIGITPDMVTHVVSTHGHPDHVEGAVYFKNARKYVHSADLPLLEPRLAAQFVALKPQTDEFTFVAEDVNGLELILVATHSPGSVAVYDQVSKALFVGDFFCYFGEALPEGQLVTNSKAIKQGSCQYVAGQAADGGADFAKFMQGLDRLLDFQAEFFCTGHGVVLCQDIQSFLKNMWQSGTQFRQM